MAKYTLDITCNGSSRKLVISRGVGESEWHISLKLLAYLLYFADQPQIEYSVGQYYKPDLVCVDGRDVTLWIDCGDITVRKLDRISTANHRAAIVVVKPTLKIATTFRQAALKRLRRPERVRYAGFDPGFLEVFETALSTRTALIANVDPERTRIEIAINSATLQSGVHWM